jgi:hypothetical protein
MDRHDLRSITYEIGAKMSQAIVPLVQDPAEEYRQYKIDQAEKEEQQRRFKQEQRERRDRAATIGAENLVASPLKEKESIANLPPDEKVQVLKAGIETMNQNGDFDYASGRSYHYRIVVSRKSLETARDFFTDNPSVPVWNVLNMLEMCCFVHHHNDEPERGEYCKHFYAWKAGASLDFFWNNLANVHTYCRDNWIGFDYSMIYPDVKRRKESEVVAQEDGNI